MAQPKVTRVPLPHEKPVTTSRVSSTPRKPTFKSQELVTVSDDESSAGSSSGRSLDSESDPEKRKNTKTPNIQNDKATEPNSPPIPSDESSESESDVEHGDGANGLRGKEQQGTKSGEGDLEERTESESSPEEVIPSKGSTRDGRNTQTVQLHPPPPYRPPTSFQSVQTSFPSSQSLDIFNPADINGKQVWYITAPATVPIHMIKQVSLERVMKGEPVIEHNGVSYGFVPADQHEQATNRLLLPTDKGYKSARYDFSSVFHLQQVAKLPQLHNTQPDGSSTTEAFAVKIVRKQPKGLKMRTKPFGFGSDAPGTIGSSDSEPEPAPRPQLRIPEAIPATISPKKRKHHSVTENGTTPEQTAKKSKKTDKKRRDVYEFDDDAVGKRTTELVKKSKKEKSKSVNGHVETKSSRKGGDERKDKEKKRKKDKAKEGARV
ncbi:hypothetical protein M501DRAFT_305336 [Patellaria atrata CBS 101060]|uniref:Uncharacterized protein n=1 Tax=Patellaria atrata CBS 101060 TaxID=1346257 RepID=A0A9P4VK11_9PEZI|nr:hypothetical protein M501DRAFT_305336 [Patellaria atrata CBS 101060]